MRRVDVDEQSRAPAPRGPNQPRYWFPAKTFGWGWGLPVTWEGWLVLVGYLGLMVVVVRACPPEKSLTGFVAAVVGLSAGLVVICWWKGEPPRWRWG